MITWRAASLSLLIVAFGGLIDYARAEAAVDNPTNRVTALFAAFDKGIQPGAAVMVLRDGKVAYSRGFGYADLATRTRISPRSAFRLASVSKQFTAMAIIVLKEAGKLDYDDPIVKYLPELTRYPGVTIRHLLTHTAGLPDYYDSIENPAGTPTNSDLATFLAAMDGPLFPPGERYEYSNPAYELLALIVEKTSGLAFRDFMVKQVFRPANMDTSLIHDHTQPQIPNRVFGYDQTADGYALNDYDPLNGIVGSGGMYATLEDFRAWDRALYGNAVVTAAELKRAWTRAALDNGDRIDYGFGWRLDQLRGHRRVAHSGSWVGFRTGFATYPDERLTIVLLTNRSEFNTGAYIDAITDIYLPQAGDEYRPPDTVTAVQRHHRRVPKDDMWWTVTGDEMAWMHKNAQQLFPTVNVHRHGPVRELEYRRMPEIGSYLVETPEGAMTFDAYLDSDLSTAMGVVILREGKIVFESYPRMQEHEKPVYWSVAKVFPATIVRLLEEREQIDVGRPIEFYIPELRESDFAGITVRNILDMASGLDCQDEYSDRESCYYQYSMAIGDGFRDAGAPDNPYDYLATLEVSKHAEQGTQFSYSGVNTFLLAWLVEKISGYPFHEVFTREIWYHLGAEADAAYIAYRYGIPLSHGGFLSNMRDLARFGLLFTPSYRVVSNRRIISDEHIRLLRSGGNPGLRANAGLPSAAASGVEHNVYQWDEIHANGNFYKGGWGGQGLIVNPEHDLVAVFASYFKDDAQSELALDTVLFDVLGGVFEL